MIKILVADDDPQILDVLEYNLVSDGYEVYCASDGEEAFELAQKHLPKLIILDVMMPKMDGVEVCEALRSKKQFQDTVIMMLTARSEDFTQIACYDNGADDFIAKPIKPKVLLSRINAVLRRYKTQTKRTQVSIGDVHIDLDKYKVTKAGNTIDMAKKEYELLVLLSSKLGKLFTREEIYNNVWGADQVVGDRTIDVHIRKIREKIGNEYIKTVKGIGYKVEI